MMELENTEDQILKIIHETEVLIPALFLDNLEINPMFKQSEWYPFESQIWKNGEKIRQLLLTDKKLRDNESIYDKIFEIATNINAKRGRQSFIMLLGNVKHLKYSAELIKQLNDDNVDGHIIDTIYKMKFYGFTKEIKPFIDHKIIWIRNLAKKYCKKYETE